MRILQNVGRFFGAVGRNFSPNRATRLQGRYQLLAGIAVPLGLRLHNHSLAWPTDCAVAEVWKGFPEGRTTFGERHFSLYYLARAAANIAGSTAECGVFEGAGSHFILSAIGRPDKAHHVFDFFEGLSQPDARDRAGPDAAFLWKAHDLAVREDVVRGNLKRFANVRYHKGWIPERFRNVELEVFSFVHIDVDLYQPTFDLIAFFYPRMSPGGVLVCDDYGFLTCPGARAAIDDFMRDKPESVVHLTTGQGIVTKRCG